MKRNIILLALIALIFSGCRKDADYHPYIGEYDKLAYDSYSTQFDYIWKCMSTGYVLWDVDETDWDAVYDEYMPKFQALDAKHEAGQDVTVEELKALYKGVVGGMKDHHMDFSVKNLFPSPSDTVHTFSINPGLIEIESRDYYIEPVLDEMANLGSFLAHDLETHYELETHEFTAAVLEEGRFVIYHYCLFALPDGRKIPYLWQSMAAITPVMDNPGTPAADLIDHWLTAIKETPREQLAGIILDNRCNTGGYQDDLDYLVGPFINERTEILKTRYKEGPGRLEHSAWSPYYLDPQPRYHRDITAENIPYVIITDIYSVSMGEIEPMVIKSVLPTGYVIGERTFGANCPLQPAASIDLNYGGPFGDINKMHHYVYTASFEAQVGGQVREGIGCIPDKEVLRKGYGGDFKPQLDAAIEYIQNY